DAPEIVPTTSSCVSGVSVPIPTKSDMSVRYTTPAPSVHPLGAAVPPPPPVFWIIVVVVVAVVEPPPPPLLSPPALRVGSSPWGERLRICCRYGKSRQVGRPFWIIRICPSLPPFKLAINPLMVRVS